MEFSYSVIKRSIKNPRLEFRHGDLFVIVSNNRIFNVEAFIARHKQWIIKHKQRYNDLEKNKSEIILQPRLAKEFTLLIENLVLEAFKLLGAKPKQLVFKSMKSRWGSCTSLGKITLNTKLRYFPDELISYVVYHEMVHLLVKNHGIKFYSFLRVKFPNYKEIDKQLVSFGYVLETQNRYSNLK